MSAQDLIKQLASLDASAFANEAARSEACIALHTIANKLETPWETWLRLSTYSPSTFAATVVLHRVGVFKQLKDLNGKSADSKTLAEKANVDQETISRFLRQAATGQTVIETGPDQYKGSPFSNATDDPIWDSAFALLESWNLSFNGGILPYLKDNGWKAPHDSRNAAWQYVLPGGRDWKDKPVFDYIAAHPEEAKNFNNYMIMQGANRPPLWAKYPLEERVFKGAKTAPGEVVYVDVAGNTGYDAKLIVKQFPQYFGEKGGKIIVEDLPEVMSKHAGSDPKVEYLNQDFFTEQKVKGARAYQLRQILHDWADEDCRKILGHLRDAMTPGYSKILVHDVILPRVNAHPFTSAQDMIMMNIGGKERTEQDFLDLVAGVPGLKVSGFFMVPGVYDGVVEIERTA